MPDKVSGAGSDTDMIRICRSVFTFPGVPLREHVMTYRGINIVVREYKKFDSDEKWFTYCIQIPELDEYDDALLVQGDMACPDHHFCMATANTPYHDRFNPANLISEAIDKREAVDQLQMYINRYVGRKELMKGRKA